MLLTLVNEVVFLIRQVHGGANHSLAWFAHQVVRLWNLLCLGTLHSGLSFDIMNEFNAYFETEGWVFVVIVERCIRFKIILIYNICKVQEIIILAITNLSLPDVHGWLNLLLELHLRLMAECVIQLNNVLVLWLETSAAFFRISENVWINLHQRQRRLIVNIFIFRRWKLLLLKLLLLFVFGPLNRNKRCRLSLLLKPVVYNWIEHALLLKFKLADFRVVMKTSKLHIVLALIILNSFSCTHSVTAVVWFYGLICSVAVLVITYWLLFLVVGLNSVLL